MPTLRQLRYFEALARHRHFTRAAEECAVSQPALSQQIRDLEAELGAALIERTAAEARPTALGLDMAARCRDILARVAEMVETARHGGQVLAGPLKLGMIPSVAPYLLPRLLPMLAARHPLATLELRESLTAALVQDIGDGRLDGAVIALPAGRPDLAELPLGHDRFLLAVPAARAADFSGARRPHLDAVVGGERLLLLEEGHCLREQALALCGATAPKLRRSLGATSLTTVLRLVAAGYGVTLLPELSVKAETGADPAIAVVRLAEPQPTRRLGLVFRATSPRRDDFEALARLLRETLGPDGAEAMRPAAD
jgi:LysR family hydrogen peroxide-inducible transcriptional activator